MSYRLEIVLLQSLMICKMYDQMRCISRDAKGFPANLIKHAQLQGSVKFPAKISTGSPISILGRNPLASLVMINRKKIISLQFKSKLILLFLHYQLNRYSIAIKDLKHLKE